MGRSACESVGHRKAPLVVIDQDDHNTARAEQAGLLYVLGDVIDEAVLHTVGIEGPKGLARVLDSYATNVFVALVAHDLNRGLFISSRAEYRESEVSQVRAGADKTVCSLVIGARRLANILTRLDVVDFMDFAAGGVELEPEQYHIKPVNCLVGPSLSQANLPKEFGVLVVAIKRKQGEPVFNPSAETLLEPDDRIIVTGLAGSMARLFDH